MSVPEVRSIESLRLHPDADLVPTADRDDLKALRASLSENGQQDPVDVTDDLVILDGRTRWTLLRELGAETVQVRYQHIPPEEQRAYMVERAVARRNLTPQQKRALNDSMRAQVIEVRANTRGAIMRIGYSQPQRAEKLGVDEATVKRWDGAAVVGADAPTSVPTHAVDKRGRPQPLHKSRMAEPPEHTAKPERRAPRDRPEPLRKSRLTPAWYRHFSLWCRRTRPEDAQVLLRAAREIHAALEMNGIAWTGEAE